MNNQTELKLENAKNAYLQLFFALALIIPTKALAWLNGDKGKAQRHPLTKIVPIVIVTLSLASISNLVSRANHHHAGLPADFTGTGIAVLVPIAVFAAVHSNLGLGRKIIISLIALVFAITSAAIQFMIYAPAGDFKLSYDLFEALAFGAGVPIAECLLAVIEFLLIEQDAATNATREKAEQDAAEQARINAEKAQRESEEREQARINAEHARELERIRIEAERHEAERQAIIKEERERAIFELEMEQKRREMEAKLDADRLRLEAKLSGKSVEKSTKPTVEKQSDNLPATSGESVEFNSKKAKIQQRRNMIFQHIQMNGDPGPSALSEQFGVDRGTIYSDLKALVGEGTIYKNGDGGYHAKV